MARLTAAADKLFTTAGVHPTHAKLFDTHGADSYYAALLKHVTDNLSAKKIVALGEMGLDYDRLEYCDKETQMKCVSLTKLWQRLLFDTLQQIF